MRRVGRLLIDGDLVAYRHACAAEKREAMPDGTPYITFDTHQASWACHKELSELVRRWNPKETTVCLSHPQNFRKAICPTYKANRRNTIRPQSLTAVMNHLRTYWPVECWIGLEADDVMGILATQPDADCVIVSGDKDLKQIPGRLSRDGETCHTISPEGADWNFYMQCLTGDSTDGYAGIRGIGPKKAEGVLQGQTDPWAAIVAAYEAAGMTEQDALKQARLARILRWEDYDMELRMVKPWGPR